MKIANTQAMKLRMNRSLAPRCSMPTGQDGIERKRGSVMLGSLWAALCIVAGWIVGMKTKCPVAGLLLGTVLGVIVARARQKGRGFAGAILAAAVLVPLLIAVEVKKDWSRTTREVRLRNAMR